MTIFDFSWRDHCDHFASAGWVHITGGVAPAFLVLTFLTWREAPTYAERGTAHTLLFIEIRSDGTETFLKNGASVEHWNKQDVQEHLRTKAELGEGYEPTLQ